jgi:hypothetical protein
VVECDLAKVEVAGSNPVSRSKKLETPVAEKLPGFSFVLAMFTQKSSQKPFLRTLSATRCNLFFPFDFNRELVY